MSQFTDKLAKRAKDAVTKRNADLVATRKKYIDAIETICLAAADGCFGSVGILFEPSDMEMVNYIVTEFGKKAQEIAVAGTTLTVSWDATLPQQFIAFSQARLIADPTASVSGSS